MSLCRHTVAAGPRGWGLPVQLVLSRSHQVSQALALLLLRLQLPAQPHLFFLSTGQSRVKKCHLCARDCIRVLVGKSSGWEERAEKSSLSRDLSGHLWFKAGMMPTTSSEGRLGVKRSQSGGNQEVRKISGRDNRGGQAGVTRKGQGCSSPWPLGHRGPPAGSALAGEPPRPSHCPVPLLSGAAREPQTVTKAEEWPRKKAWGPALPCLTVQPWASQSPQEKGSPF